MLFHCAELRGSSVSKLPEAYFISSGHDSAPAQ
jgi:hypothetical protein